MCWLCVGCGVQTTVFSKFLPQGFSKSTASRNYGACPNPTTRLNRGHACKRYQTMSKRERERDLQRHKKCIWVLGRHLQDPLWKCVTVYCNAISWVLTCAQCPQTTKSPRCCTQRDNSPNPNQQLHVRPQFLPHAGACWPSSSRIAEGHTGPCGWNGIL